MSVFVSVSVRVSVSVSVSGLYLAIFHGIGGVTTVVLPHRREKSYVGPIRLSVKS